MKRIFKIISLIIAMVLLISLVVYSRRLYLKNAYPIKYSEFVLKYSEENNLDPYFVYAVIRTESDFQKNATSSVNAKGLMQITEITFDWINTKLGDKQSSFEDMYNPETNIRYGTFLLSFLKNELGSNKNILCGYHAGINKAKEWLKDAQISTDGEIIESKIPFPDTKAYVNKVMKTYNMYLNLYN